MGSTLLLALLLSTLSVLSAVHSKAPPNALEVLSRSIASPIDDTQSVDADGLRLTDIVLAASVDGKFHALNRSNGAIRWSMQQDQTVPESHSFLHDLVRSNHSRNFDIHEDDLETYIVEPQSGNIFIFPPKASPYTPLEKLGYTVAQLVELSPFSFGGDQRTFLGRKETSIITLDIDTGRVISIINADNCLWEEASTTEPDPSSISVQPEDATDHSPRKRPRRVAVIGRTDYYVSIHISGRGIVQHLVYSEYGPNNINRDKQALWTRTPDSIYIQSLPNGYIHSVLAAAPADQDPFGWNQRFASPIVAIFDVVFSPTNPADLILLLQPRPRIGELFTDPVYEPQLSMLGELTHVGMVGRSLYAMSHYNFPLVALTMANAPRGGIDPHFGGTEVCGTLECLVGTHESGYAASSRVSRLIDGRRVLQIEGPEVTHSPLIPPSNTSPAINTDYVTLDAIASASLPVAWLSVATTVICAAVGMAWMKWGGIKSRKAVASSPMHEAPTLSMPPSDPLFLNEPSTPPKDELQEAEGDESDVEGRENGDTDASGTPRKKRRNRGRGGKGKKKVAIVLEAEPNGDVVVGDSPPLEALARLEGNPVAGLTSQPPPIAPGPFLSASPFLPRPEFSSLSISDSVLGFGSHGTIVYRGSFQGRAVAVKRLLADFVTLASREVTLLQESDDHPNVIRYFYQEAQSTFLYIALELCPASLEDILQRPADFAEISAVFQPKRALAQITSGLRHLHSLKIVHRDIKPQNILISQAKNGVHRCLISDFGLCKKLDSDETSFLPTRHGPLGAGTVGWRAPEILSGDVKLDVSTVDSLGGVSTVGSLGGMSSASGSGNDASPRTRLTKSVDIFALGCLFFYTLTGGEHPYGGPFERESNIMKDQKDLSWLDKLGEEGEEAKDLIAKMLDPQPRHRLDTTACLIHPFFWTPARRLGFLQDASDRFEIMERDPPERGLVELETGALGVVGSDWQRRLDKVFLDNLGKFRKYKGGSVQDLLRALRNKKHHYQDLPDNVKRHLGPLPDGFLAYFTVRFPKLFLHVYYTIANSPRATESMFRSYFELHEV